MEEIYRLWDSLLLSPPSMPLFFAVALMKQLRRALLILDFNALILFFSRLPHLDIEAALLEANALFDHTPLSLVIQKQTPDDKVRLIRLN